MDLLLGNNTELEQQLEEIGKAITQAIQTAANKAIPITRLGPKPKAWWNKELTKLRQDTSHYRRIFKEKLETTAIHDAYLEKRDFLQKEDPQSIYKAMAYTKDNKVERIPPIQGETSFDKKYQAFRNTLFPPPPITEAPTFTNY
ncbi:hypothetical protein PtrM4_116570 [Pyrenophora tritici-repentis]|uniref:Uncharacterized protein n=1 Tax=Pyrenophora tritici-repentis TaxID=45151 RepID=A0A834VPF4_9PLEO|nr:hypothetical protein PtrM4_116570 [Pyrenophora tritici-repentis]